MIAVAVVSGVEGFGTRKVTPCGSQLGFALGAESDDGHETVGGAPLIAGAGVALSYRRAELAGALGHFVGSKSRC